MMQLQQSPSSNRRELAILSQPRESSNEKIEIDDPEKAMASIARLIDQLHAKKSSPQEKELSTARLLGLARGKKDARKIIGSHPQSMPALVSLLRDGTPLAKVNIAGILSVLCRDENLRLKVLIGGSIPPLLTLLKSESRDAKSAAAEAIYEVSSAGVSDDHAGEKIFVTEGVVTALWDNLNSKKKQDKVVEGFVVGALRNLCGDKDGFWRVTLEGGGTDVILRLLSSDNAVSQSNAASLLARLVVSFSDCIPKVINSGAVNALLQLLSDDNDISIRASAAEALEALSLKSTEAKKAVRDADGIHILIKVIAKKSLQGEHEQALQRHATRALANVCDGMSALITYLGHLSLSPRLVEPIAEILGALAYALMIFEENSDEEMFDLTKIESILVKLLKPRDTKLIQERILEAMASLYGNISLSKFLNHADAKRLLARLVLITTDTSDVRERLIISLSKLCQNEAGGVWESIGKREGIQLLVSFLGLSSQQHQENAIDFLVILTDQVDESKWAVTAAGGIPPLVQLLESGVSPKARENIARILWNLCCHSEEIRVCIETSGAIPAFLWLLKNGGPRAQEDSAKTLIKLVQTADDATIDQLLALYLGDSPKSKVHITRVLGHVLTVAPHKDLVETGSAANKGLRSLVQSLTFSNEEMKEPAASALADILSSRQDLCDSLEIEEVDNPSKELLSGNSQKVATQLSQALGALSRPRHSPKKTTGKKKSYVLKADVKPLIKSARNSSIDSAENAVADLTNLLSDPNTASEALLEDVVSALTRVLKEGTLQGKKDASQALHLLLEQFPANDVFKGNAQHHAAVQALADLLAAMNTSSPSSFGILELVSLLARTKQGTNLSDAPLAALSETPSSLEHLVKCLAEGLPSVQDKSIEVLSRLCGVQPVLLGELLVARSRSISSLADRIMNSSDSDLRIGGAALLVCAAKRNKKVAMDALGLSRSLKPLIHVFVDMMKLRSTHLSIEFEVKTPRVSEGKNAFREKGVFDIADLTTLSGGTVASWLLSVICSFHPKNRLTVMEAGGLEAVSGKLARYTSSPQAENEDPDAPLISSLLLAVMFQDASIVPSATTMLVISSLALLLKSKEVMDRYFAAQALASLVCNRNKDICIAIGNSGAIIGLINSLECAESDIPNLAALSEEFSLVQKPFQIVLEHLFGIRDVRLSSAARESIPLLVDLLRPVPGRPEVSHFAAQLLTRIAGGSDTNKLLIAKAGAVDALSKYLPLSPQDPAEHNISELMRALFSLPKNIKNVYKLLSSGGSSMEQKISAARLCYVIFGIKNVRKIPAASECMEPLISLMQSGDSTALEAGLFTFERLLDVKKQLEFAREYDVLNLLMGLLSCKTSHQCTEASISSLTKLGKDQTPHKLDMVKAGLIDTCLELLPGASSSLCSRIAELFRILTTSDAVARSPEAMKMVEPLFTMLLQGDMSFLGQQSALQAFVHIFEKHQIAALNLTPADITRLFSFLESPCPEVRQLSAEIVTHFLSKEHLQQDSGSKDFIVPLVRLVGIQIVNLQQTALQALEKISATWPKEVAEAGGIVELSKVIVDGGPQTSLIILESAAFVLCNIVRSNEEYYYDVPLLVFVKMLFSTEESTVMLALNALIVQEKNNASCAEDMAEEGAISAILDLLGSHHCEEPSLRLLEAILNNTRVQEMKICRYVIAPLSEYLLDPQTTSKSCKLLAAMALRDISQNERLARGSDSVYACRALVCLLEDQPEEETKLEVVNALQNFVLHSRTNRRAVAEAGGILLIQELLMTCNPEVAGQAALMIKFIFSNHTLQKYLSPQLIRSLTLALERELELKATINVEVVRTLNVIFTNFHKLRASEAATQSIPHLVRALEHGSKDAQESVLDTLYLLRQSWLNMPAAAAKSQASLAAEAIPVLQTLMKTCPPTFHKRSDSLLHFLPGCLTVTIKRGNNLTQSVGSTNAFCTLILGNDAPKQTKVVKCSKSPEWMEGFTWVFDVPPRGQELQIICKSKNKFRMRTLGTVTISIDMVQTEGIYSGVCSLNQNTNKDGSYKTLEVEMTWSHLTPDGDK